MNHQTEMVNLDDLVDKSHHYRFFKEVLNQDFVTKSLKGIKKEVGREGFGIVPLFYALLLQFMEDLSDRECERFLRENNAGKWFCDFTLGQKTPDHNTISRARKRIGTNKLSFLFSRMRDQLQSHGLISEVFTFIDASSLIAKSSLWKERDKAIQQKYDKLNNEILPKVATDKQAKIGCKGRGKYWYGYKRHVSVDMQSGLINKAATTPANMTDAKGMKHVCPKQGAVYADKGYCTKPAKDIAKSKGVHLAAIKNNNMLDKNKDLDKFHSFLRMPYERVFSKVNKRTRYRGIAKNQFLVFMQSICFNLKRLKVLDPPVLILS